MQKQLVDVEHACEKAVGWGRDCTASMEQPRVGKEGLFCSAGWWWGWTAYRAVIGEKGTTLACRDQEHGGTLWIQGFSPVLHLVGLDQVNVEQSWSCSDCRAQQGEQWVERTRFKVENGHGEGATAAWRAREGKSLVICFGIFCWSFLVELSLVWFPPPPHLQCSLLYRGASVLKNFTIELPVCVGRLRCEF